MEHTFMDADQKKYAIARLNSLVSGKRRELDDKFYSDDENISIHLECGKENLINQSKLLMQIFPDSGLILKSPEEFKELPNIENNQYLCKLESAFTTNFPEGLIKSIETHNLKAYGLYKKEVTSKLDILYEKFNDTLDYINLGEYSSAHKAFYEFKNYVGDFSV